MKGPQVLKQSNAHPIILKLREVRRSKQISREAVAHKMNVHVNTIIYWEMGHRSPPLDKFLEWAEILGFKAHLLVKESS